MPWGAREHVPWEKGDEEQRRVGGGMRRVGVQPQEEQSRKTTPSVAVGCRAS